MSGYVDHGHRHGRFGTDPIPGATTNPLQVKIIEDNVTLRTGDAQMVWVVTDDLDGLDITEVVAYVTVESTSGSITAQLRNYSTNTDMLSTPMTIEVNEFTSRTAGTPPVISSPTLTAGEFLCCDVDAAGTGPRGLLLVMYF